MTDFNKSKVYWSEELAKVENFVLNYYGVSLTAKERSEIAIKLLLLDRLDTIANRLDLTR